MADVYADLTQFHAYGLPAVALDGFDGDVIDHIAAASSVFDSHARGRYSVPLAVPVALEVVMCVCACAAYTVLSIRGFDPENEANVNVRMRYDDCKTWMKDLASGKVNLDNTADATPAKSEGAPIVRSRPRDDSRRFRR